MPPRARVLLVGCSDDDLRAALDDAGYEAVDVDDPRAAVAAGGIDCVVAALDPPDAAADADSGFDVARSVRAVDALLPVVVVGDEPRSAVAEAALETDVTGYVRRGVAEDPGAAVLDELAPAVEQYRRGRDAQTVLSDGPAGGCVVRDGVVTYATPSLTTLFGDALEGRPVGDLVAEGDEPDVQGLARLEAARSVEFEAVDADGRRRTIEAHWRPAEDGEAVVGTLVDVTERADREERLRESEAMLDSLLENVPLSIYFKDRQSRHERVSDHITRTDPEEYIRNTEGKVHPHPDDVIGKTDFDLYAPEFAEEVVADDRRVMEDEEPIVDRIEEGTTSLGEDQYTSTTKAPRYDETGDVVGLVGVTVDVTDRVQYRKELERQNERLNEFAEVLTHDLRNPVNIARGYVDLLAEGHDPDAVDACSDALDRIDRLIEEIRAFVVEGRTVEDPVPVDLERAAREAWSTVDTGDAALEVDAGRRIRADPDRLRRLLENLFRNAVEHGSTSPQSSSTPEDAVEHGATNPDAEARGDAVEQASEGGRSLTVRVESTDEGFAVADDGTGIPESDRERVFERGYTTDADGTGFGLAIVRNIAEAHGWSVAVAGSQEGGARFEFGDVVLAEEGVGRTYGAQ